MHKALLVSHSGQRCGVYQYGVHLLDVLRSSGRVNWGYGECGRAEDLEATIADFRPDIILFNYQASTLPWLTSSDLKKTGMPTVGIFHESDQSLVDTENGSLFDYWLCPDPTIIPRNPRIWKVPRFIPEYSPLNTETPSIMTIGSFGFATRTKGFERLCALVNAEFDQAVIRLNMPEHDNPSIMDVTLKDMTAMCRAEITKPGIRLDITHHFFDDPSLLQFLSENTINAFLYQDQNAKGISSCVDFALAANRPLAVTKSPMFSHLAHVNPSIFIEDASLGTIARNGTAALTQMRRIWSKEDASRAWNDALASILDCRNRSLTVPDGRGFNKILDDRSRRAYRAALDEVRRLSPEMITRKIERANIQQAFAYDTVFRIMEGIENAKILAAGSFEDTAVDALRKRGYVIDEVDPNVNAMTLLDYYVRAADKLGTYDIVLSVSVLEHVADDVQFMRIATEFLKPGGHAVLTVDFKEQWRPELEKPVVDHRLYTTERINRILMTAVGNCVLLDVPVWSEGDEDFEYEGCQYGFAGVVLRKLEADAVKQAAVKPVWSDLLAAPRATSLSEKDLMTPDGETPTNKKRLPSIRSLLRRR